MWIDLIALSVRVLIFVIVVRIIVEAVSKHNRETRVQAGRCVTATIPASAAVELAQTSVATPAAAPVTMVKGETVVPVAPVAEARFCPSCGAKRSPDARYCTMCSSELA